MDPQATFHEEYFDAVLFDLDGVLTDSAKIHSVCWKRMFDAFLDDYGRRKGQVYAPFDIAADYRRYVDGKLRYDGVRSFLESRAIHLDQGYPDDPPEAETVCGLGNRKDLLVGEVLAKEGVAPYEGSLSLVRFLKDKGYAMAVVSASKNCRAVLDAARLTPFFEVVVEGSLAAEEGLAGKPSPATFLRAAELLGVAPERSVVLEDAVSGVQAGRSGGFGLVVGVAREGNAEELAENGADLVVEDLAELLPTSRQS